ncbi:uncharacterized protein UHOD_03279 [Ustilago sp. UG-2017b]|nr:uncharacterized protein UHOD_03279 [Ustilago sp. UG-2017b]
MQHAMGRRSDPSSSSTQSSASQIPASLGIATPANQKRSLSERLGLSSSASSSSHSSQRKPSDGLQSSNADSTPRRNAAECGSFPSIPSWGPQTHNSFSNPLNGLSVSSSMGSLRSASVSSSSRNFLVPIGATGARQKLSIANASQRRRLAASDDARASIQGSHSPQPNKLRLQRSQSDFHNLAPSAQQGSYDRGVSSSSTVSNFASSRASASSNASQATLPTNATSTELMQQAAMQRLSSQRILPNLKTRSVSEKVMPAQNSPSRSPIPPAASISPSVERDQSFASTFQTQPAPAIAARRLDSSASIDVPSNVPTALASRANTVIVPDRTASSLKPAHAHFPPPPRVVDEPRPDLSPLLDSNGINVDSSIASRPLTIAETYKRAMLERDAQRARTAARAAPTPQTDTQAPTPPPQVPAPASASASVPTAASTTATATATATVTATPTTSAPTLDLNLPISSFFYDDDNSAASSSLTAQPNQLATYGASASPRSRDPYSNLNDAPKAPASPVSDENRRRMAALASTSPQKGGANLPSLQRSYDEAMAIQDRIRMGVTDEPEFGGLFDGSSPPKVRRSKEESKAGRSYLALRDEEEDTADRQLKRSPKPDTAASASTSTSTASRGQVQKPRQVEAASIAKSAPIPPAAAVMPQTPPGDKSFVQLSTPDDDRSTPKNEPNSLDLTPSPKIEPSTAPAVALAAQELERPSLSRESSLQTFRSPPNKLESQPGPREEAALQAGASAAITTSPLLAVSQMNATATNNDRSPDLSSPISNGERTVQSSEDLSDANRWKRSQDVLAAFSPAQQSRFSEASTDFSDSRAPTRNENRYSGRASSVSSNDGLEEESSDGHMLPTSAWQEVENAHRRFRDKNSGAAADRGHLLRAVLLPFLALEAETASVEAVGSGVYVKGKARRALFFDWIRSLLLELQHVQTSADRGAILESIACIIESRNFSASILSTNPEDEARFSSVFGHILSYAMGELNKKGVYQNTLIFSGRLLAVAFFRVNGVASKLLRALPVNRFALERVAREFEWKRKRPTDFQKFANRFPATLRQLCYKDSREYLKMLDSESIAGAGNGSDSGTQEDDRFLVCQPEVEVEMSGNWLRRWQSDDSELFFSFCRSYHRQLASLYASSKSLESVSKYFFGGPGYAHLATCVHQKCLALVHRVILSVTTLSSQKNFNPAGETANVLSGSTAGKPRILEAANRRCTAIVVDIVRAPAGTNMIFAPMLGLHIKALIKRTSLYDVQGVFCLLDWLDGVISHMDSNDLINEGLIDVSFIITTIGMLLENADHALALMRTIAFCYANFGVLTATTENRIYFCEQILLKPTVFHKLFLSWSFTIRAYYLHLLVFRLARIRDFPPPRDDPGGRTALCVVRLFNQRLEALRNRHDSLSPEIDSSSDDTKSEDSKSRKSGTLTFVSTIKRASTDGDVTSEGSAEGRAKAEKIMGMTAVDGRSATSSPAVKPESGKKVSHSKTKSWLKAFGRSSSSNKLSDKAKGGESHLQVGVFSPTSGKVMSPTESDDDSKTIGSARTTPRTSFESTSSDAISDVSTLAGSVRGNAGGRSSKNGAGFEFDIKQQTASQQQQQQQQSRASLQASKNAANSAVLSLAHNAGIAKDTVFDLQSTHAHPPPTPGRTPQSPRISKAFSRRASMLPGPASELVASMMEGEEEEVPPIPDLPADTFGLGLSGMNGGLRASNSADVYDESLHIYAVQSLREYEQTVQEHDEFFASLPEEQSAQVPRLPVNWPAMWSSTGE